MTTMFEEGIQHQPAASATDIQPGSLQTAIALLRSRLRYFIEPDFGLLDELVSRRLLSHEDSVNVRALPTAYCMNDAVLSLLNQISEPQCRLFLGALNATDQDHVVNFIQCQGELSTSENIPLDDAHLSCLDVNGVELQKLIVADQSFLNQLYDASCITTHQREYLMDISQSRDRVRKLLEFIRRRSMLAYNMFLRVIAETQPRLAEALLNLKGVEVVCGVARLDEVLYVVCRRSSTVRAFSATSLQPLTNIDVHGLKSPSDIVVCPESRQLYVSAYDTRVVWRINLLDQWQQSSPETPLKHPQLLYEKWIKTEMQDDCISLSVTLGQLIVSCAGERRVRQFVCKDRQHLRDVQIMSRDHDITGISHVILTRDDTFVALYTWQSGDSRRLQVGEFDSTGQQLRTSDIRWISLFREDHLTTVGAEGHLLVTDRDNERVLEFNSALQLQRTLIKMPVSSQSGPRRLCYHDQHLHVAHSGSQMSVFTFALANIHAVTTTVTVL